jgi:sulfatase modifying factor 1
MRIFVCSPWRPLVAAALWLWLAPAAVAVTFDWGGTVGRPGNACDQQPWGCFGSVDYFYRVAQHEVTNGQYVEFLNAKAASDPHGLYNPNMATGNGGITRSGSDGSYSYSAIAGRGAMPVNFVSVFDAMRFVNWVHNGQGDGDTEAGAYTMPTSQFGLPPARNFGAGVFLLSNDEWHKAAYYDADAGVFFDYPAGSDTVVTCSAPTSLPNRANCGGVVGGFTPVGSYPGSPSPSDTFDQAGNVQEWTETEVEDIETWFIRGGSSLMSVVFNEASHQDDDYPDRENGGIGFRVATLADDPAGENCGNGICEDQENALTCPADCPDMCGDGLCTGDEDVLSCPGECPDVCGDGICTGDEDTTNCASDCGSDCGDGVCNGGEGTTSCPADCGTDCGDGICNGGESSATCVPDCGVVCGDGYCAMGESCPEDCGPACGNGVLEGGEQCEAGVPLGDTCASLGFDSGDLSCNAATCQYDTSDCANNSCLPSWASCSSDADCCSGDCTSWWWFRICQ